LTIAPPPLRSIAGAKAREIAKVPQKFVAISAATSSAGAVIAGAKAAAQLHGLEQLPATGFTVICFQVKITAASAGWTRCVAVLDD
jgi:hypothetical protein